MNTTNPRTMTTDKQGWNVTPIIDLPYDGGLLRLNRDGTMRRITADGQSVAANMHPVSVNRINPDLLAPEDLATFDAWNRDQDRFASIA